MRPKVDDIADDVRGLLGGSSSGSRST